MTAIERNLVFLSLRYLGGRHPSEVSLTLGQMAEVAAVATEIEKANAAVSGIRIG